MQKQRKKSATFYSNVGTSYGNRKTSFTTTSSPNKLNKFFFSRNNSTQFTQITQNSIDLSKKSVSDFRYYLQVHKKKMRNALISKNFQQSNISPQLSQHFHNRGLKGSKIHNKKGFRKNKYIQLDEIGCLQPPQTKQKLHSGLIARHNKPNLMYNLDLFRKKYSKELQANSMNKIEGLKNQSPHFFSHINWHKKGKTLKTQEDKPKIRSFSQRQYS